MKNTEEYIIESWVPPLSSIEKPGKISIEYMKKYLEEVYNSLETSLPEEEVEYYFDDFFSN